MNEKRIVLYAIFNAILRGRECQNILPFCQVRHIKPFTLYRKLLTH